MPTSLFDSLNISYRVGNTLVKNAANERSSGLGPSSLLTGLPNSFLMWARVKQHWYLLGGDARLRAIFNSRSVKFCTVRLWLSLRNGILIMFSSDSQRNWGLKPAWEVLGHTVNPHPPVHHRGWMIRDQETRFLLGSSSLANHGGWLSWFIYYLPTRYKLSMYLVIPYFVTYLSIY